MDQERFDQLARGLAAGISRRGMVRKFTGTALGSILVAVGASEARAKKKHGHGKGKGKTNDSSAGKDKVAVCHYDADAQTYVLINVSQSGWDNGHSKHKKDFQQADKNGCCLDSDCAKLNDTCQVGKCVVNEQRVGACKAVPTPNEPCDDGDPCTVGETCNEKGQCAGGSPKCGDGETCDESGTCVCKPKTCADLGRVCGTAPDDGCGNPLDCGPASVCGSDIETNCCGGRCCKANAIACSSNAECCNGDCRGIGSLKTCWAFTDYTCAQ
jgi:hypothetical protein